MSNDLTATIQQLYRVLGPKAPGCCEGCQAEINEALNLIRASDVDVSEMDMRIERRRQRHERKKRSNT